MTNQINASAVCLWNRTSMRVTTCIVAACLLMVTGCTSPSQPSADNKADTSQAATSPAPSPASSAGLHKETPAVLNFTMNDIQGRPVSLTDYQGKVILMVNTASKCGYTKQYAGLEALYKAHQDEGLVILGFPANNFGGQEPGTNEQIAEFCQANFGVTFPMFSKISVKGDDQHPLYHHLTDAATNPASPGDVKWNFEKFLISRDGRVIGRYASKVTPESAELTSAIQSALAANP